MAVQMNNDATTEKDTTQLLIDFIVLDEPLPK
jgi:hypothetical protein